MLKWLRVGLEKKQEGCWFVVEKGWEGLEKRVGGVKGVQVGRVGEVWREEVERGCLRK